MSTSIRIDEHNEWQIQEVQAATTFIRILLEL